MALEAFRRERVIGNRGGLFLFVAQGIRIDGMVHKPSELAIDRRVFQGVQLHGINNYRLPYSDGTIIRKLLVESVPLTIVGRESNPPRFAAELARFPYSVDGHPGYQAFSLRLVPEVGSVDTIVVNHNRFGISDEHHFMDFVALDVGNRVHVEVYYDRPREPLEDLSSHNGFQEHVVTPSPQKCTRWV